MSTNGKVVKEGDSITLDGSEGVVYTEAMPLVVPQLPKSYETLMKWADETRRLRVRTNVDTPQDARKAIEFGAEGIGLCRTEHMFFTDFEQPGKTQERRGSFQKMILADKGEPRVKALKNFLPSRRRVFRAFYKAGAGLPPPTRLFAPPLHEFVPHERAKQEE